MSIRLRIVFIISAIAAIVTFLSFFVGITMSSRYLARTIEHDTRISAALASEMAAARIDALKSGLQKTALVIKNASEEEAPDLLARQTKSYVGFLVLRIMYRDGRIVTDKGMTSTNRFIGSPLVERAFAGETVISSTEISFGHTLVIRAYTPIDENRIMILTLPGMMISDMVTGFKVWDVGNIFVLDKTGTTLANFRRNLVEERYNELLERKQDDSAAEIFGRMTAGQTGVGYYNYDGERRVCAYQPIPETDGWSLGVAVPIPDGPASRIARTFLISSSLVLALGILAALLAASTLARPFEQIREQNKKLEELGREAEAASHAKSNFLANMSHEIRTPMNVVLGMTEMMLRDTNTSPDQLRENLTLIRQAGASLLALINDILDLSKVESGKMEIIEAPYYVESLLNDVIYLIRERAMEKRLLFICYIQSDLPKGLSGDATRIRQILVNLLSNAVKYTNEGSVMLEVCGRRREREDVLDLTVTVTDTGIGIKQDDIGKLFTDYAQLNVKKNRAIEGSGLGLAITKRLCTMMSGCITVKSEYGKGSAFSVVIPQKVSSAEPLTALPEAETYRVLVFSEASMHSTALVRELRDLGVETRETSAQAEFLREFETGAWPFVFMGAQEFRQVKEMLTRSPHKAAVRVFTAWGEDSSDIRPEGSVKMIPLPVWGNSLAAMFGSGADTEDLPHTGQAALFTAPEATVLIVDDMPSNIIVIAGLIAPTKIKTHRCTSGEKAIELAQTYHYDIIFMDHMMPGIDGVEATAEIRQWEAADPGRGHATIIALTANAMVGMKEMFLESGFDDYLAKPIEASRLNDILWKWIPKDKQVV